MQSRRPRSVIEKIWDDHVVSNVSADEDLLFIDRVLMHERTGPQLLEGLRSAGRQPAYKGMDFGVVDHIVDTSPDRSATDIQGRAAEFIPRLRELTAEAGIQLFDVDDPRQGIVHVISPELGIALPGCTLVCADSHTCTVGGIGALAWGIGSTEGEHAVATQTLVMRRPRLMQVRLTGKLQPGVTAKDMALSVIARFSNEGANGCAVEFCGEAVTALDMEARMTLCNMAAEFGAFTAVVAPDEMTIEWVRGRPFAPKGEVMEQAAAHWRTLFSDPDAQWDVTASADISDVKPQVTWGISPYMGLPIDGRVPDPATWEENLQEFGGRALRYMGLEPGQAIAGVAIEAAFIGSCTNSRLSDLRMAANVVRGRRVAPGVLAIVVPGSMQVRAAAEAEGLDRVFIDAGFEWRASGCSLCVYNGSDSFRGAKRVISTTNRNFENRQGPGVQTHLASPATVAASAVAGRIADPRPLLG
ncbi:3-isopropylmalate dehydratase large subunit [Variovorax sp. LjRoot178]|uniref:3-isopropylmalate dehydratase large subunit n=1 Tax=Variovorax sp. LjRoot178 TaxID=3342277 RepID=UPI003ED0C547